MANSLLVGLEVYWEMGAASNADQVDVVNNVTASRQGAIEQAVGLVGNCARLNFGVGSDHYIIAGGNSRLIFGDEDFSISAWTLQINETGGSGAIIAQWTSTNERAWTLHYSQTPNAMGFNVSPDGTNTNQGPGVLSNVAPIVFNTTWYHTVAVHDSVNNLLKIYCAPHTGSHGAPATAAYSAGCWGSSTADTKIGRLDTSGPGYLHGYVDEVGVWRKALTDEDVDTLFNGGSGLAYSSFTGSATVHIIDNVDLESAEYRTKDFTLSVMHRADSAAGHPYSRPSLQTQDYTSDSFSKADRDWSARYIRNYYTIPPSNFWQWYRLQSLADAQEPYVKEDGIRLFLRLYKESQSHHVNGPVVTATAKDTANIVPVSFLPKGGSKDADVIQWDDVLLMDSFLVDVKWVPSIPHWAWRVTTTLLEVKYDANNYVRLSALGAATPEREYNLNDIYGPHEPQFRLEKVRGGVSEFTRDFTMYHSYGGTGSGGEWMLEDTIRFELSHYAGQTCQLRILKGEVDAHVEFNAPVAFGGGFKGDVILSGPGLWSQPKLRNTHTFTREATGPKRVVPMGREGIARRLIGTPRNPVLNGERDPNTGIINTASSNAFLAPDDFNRGDNADLGSKWWTDKQTGNGFNIISNKASCAELGWERWDNTPKHRDYILEADLAINNDNDEVGIFGRYERYRNEPTCYMARLVQTGASAATLEIVRWWEGTAEVLSSDAFDTYSSGTEYHVTMTFSGNSLTAKADGTPEAVYTGSTGVDTFTGNSVTDAPMTAGRLIIEFTIGGVVYQETDDGAGEFNNVNGFLTSGTIDYTTGALTLTFDPVAGVPDDGTDINAIQTEATTTTTDSFLPKPGRLGIYGSTGGAAQFVTVDNFTATRNHTTGVL